MALSKLPNWDSVLDWTQSLKYSTAQSSASSTTCTTLAVAAAGGCLPAARKGNEKRNEGNQCKMLMGHGWW